MAELVSDESIQYTNNDATNFKYYATKRGYWKDDYVKHFCKLTAAQEQEHKAPEMSRGYYARVHAIRNLVEKFLALTNCKCQLISIGAGFDTLYFNLKSKNNLPVKLIEFDFINVCKMKIRQIRVRNLLTNENNLEFSSNQTDIYSDIYNLVSCDLRDLNEFDLKLSKLNLDSQLPTLVVSECVLIYMADDKSSALINHLSQKFTNAFYLNYEPFNLNDRFGQVMLDNMEKRSCKLLGVKSCMDEDSQVNRFKSNGFNNVKMISMTKYYNEYISLNDRRRIESIEFLDEVELLFQLLDHYCVALASNNTLFDLNDLFNPLNNNYLQ